VIKKTYIQKSNLPTTARVNGRRLDMSLTFNLQWSNRNQIIEAFKMRATPIVLLILGFTVFASAAIIGATGKVPGFRPYSFLAMNAYAAPVPTAPAKNPHLMRAEAWLQYRAQIKMCVSEPAFFQDACFQQARRERKQNSGASSKTLKPQPAKPQMVASKSALIN
jgi:hypothetical protein